MTENIITQKEEFGQYLKYVVMQFKMDDLVNIKLLNSTCIQSIRIKV